MKVAAAFRPSQFALVAGCKGGNMSTLFDALWVEEQADGAFRRSIVQRRVDDLPSGDLLIRVHYSSLNYKDALSASGNRGVTRKYPHTPGIDAAGVVVASDSPDFQPGDEVIVIGYDLGMNTPGGFGGYIRVPASWATPRPPGLTLRASMALGTAGFTAAQCVDALLQHGVTPAGGEVLVTGATGGVGSIAVALLSKLGMTVVAATGKPEEADYLHDLGAHAVIARSEVDDASGNRCCVNAGRASSTRLAATFWRRRSRRRVMAARWQRAAMSPRRRWS
jgi:acrylyl-CoA reductase (NADPH)